MHSTLGLLTNGDEFINGLSHSLQLDYETLTSYYTTIEISDSTSYAWKTGVDSKRIKTTGA